MAGALARAQDRSEGECAAAQVKPHSTESAEIMAEARLYSKHEHFPQARAMYLWLLEDSPYDDDAHVALARVDAWDGCYDRAEQRLREVLGRNPGNHEARGALVDVLMWQLRYDDAHAVLEAGLKDDPNAGELWMRLARLHAWEGDATRAVEAADRAAELMPDDEAARDLREHMYLYQLRVFVRDDIYPPAYANIYSAGLQFLRRWHKFELTLDGTWVARAGGLDPNAIIDGIYSVGLLYHIDRVTLGLGLGFGLPARAIPALTAKGSAEFPLIPRWSGLLGYAFWEYENGKRIHIFNAGIAYELSDAWRFDLLWWFTHVLAPRPASFYPQVSDRVHVVSLRVSWRHSPHFMIGGHYTWGPQLDQTEDPEKLLSLNSHLFGFFADWLITHEWGLQPSVDFEWRRQEDTLAMWIVSVQLAAYHRWPSHSHSKPEPARGSWGMCSPGGRGACD